MWEDTVKEINVDKIINSAQKLLGCLDSSCCEHIYSYMQDRLSLLSTLSLTAVVFTGLYLVNQHYFSEVCDKYQGKIFR